MNKNKKVLLTIITILVSTMLFTNKVKAVYMYLECEYSENCEANTEGFADRTFAGRFCRPKFNIWVPLTNNMGGLSFYATFKDFSVLGYRSDDFGSIPANECYIKNEKDYDASNCDDIETIDGGSKKIYLEGICPSMNTSRNHYPYSIVPVGTGGKVITSEKLEKNEYIIYSFESKKNEPQVFIELYYRDGRYGYIGPNPTSTILSDEITMYQLYQIHTIGKDYFRVASNFDSLMIASKSSILNGNWRVCQNGKDDCIQNHKFEVLLDSENSADSKYKLDDVVNKWLEENNKEFEEIKDFSTFFDENQDFIKKIEEMNKIFSEGKKYEFSEHNITAEEMVGKIEESYNILSSFYARSLKFKDYTELNREDADLNADDSALTYLFSKYLNVEIDINELAYKDDIEHYLNISLIRSALKEDISNSIKNNDSNLKSINVLNAKDKASEYTKLLYTAVLYLDSNSMELFPQNSNLTTRVFNLRDKLFPDLVEKNNLDIYPVVDCKGLIGESLLEKIKSYLNIIKIAVPIILIGMGIVDFTKAIFSNDEETMKKSQKSFIKRLAIAILIFLAPTIMNLLLQLANKVWPIIKPDSCGIFE